MKASLLFALGFLVLAGCTTMSRSDKEHYRELKSLGIRGNDQEAKSPALAGALNILPGFGNFYLASGTEESDQWLYGFLNLLCWPVSPIWAIPQAAIDAGTINKKETVYYYIFDRNGQRELGKLKAAQ
ncbi:MAG: hypothetical protein WCI40_03655 [Verrucomicrobiota bacterium]